jgi:acylglycerol lipase
MKAFLLFVMVFAACAHTPNLPVRPDPAPPEGSTAETITAGDGTQLYARHWEPAAGEVRAVVVIMHGLKDHSAHYASLAARLVGGGYSVHAFDLRGHGRSAGPRVAPRRWTDYVDDLDRFLTSVEAKHPGKPVFLFGHSMGGAIAALTAERHSPKLAGLILSGPALAVDAPPLLIAATRMSGALTPSFPAFKLNNKDFSSDPAVVKAMDEDPLISQPPAPAKTAKGLIDGIEAIWTGIDQLTMPLLALHGSRDRLTAPSGSRALIATAPSTDKSLHIYAGFFHDLLHEPGHQQVEDDLVTWLDAHATGHTVTPPPIETRHLRGDPRGWAQAVQLGGGIVSADSTTDLALELAVDVARPRPVGLSGALTARITGDAKAIAVRPLGIGARAGGSIFALSIGPALVNGPKLALSGGLWAEQPVGPAHVGALAEWTRLFNDSTGAGPLGSDLLTTQLSVRFGGDRYYWPHARAGVGPYLAGGFAWAGDVRATLITIGLHMYGAD